VHGFKLHFRSAESHLARGPWSPREPTYITIALLAQDHPGSLGISELRASSAGLSRIAASSAASTSRQASSQNKQGPALLIRLGLF